MVEISFIAKSYPPPRLGGRVCAARGAGASRRSIALGDFHLPIISEESPVPLRYEQYALRIRRVSAEEIALRAGITPTKGCGCPRRLNLSVLLYVIGLKL